MHGLIDHVLSAPVVMDSSSDDAKNDDMTVGQCEAGETNSNFECSIKLEESHHSASTHDLVDKHLRGGSYEVYTEGDYIVYQVRRFFVMSSYNVTGHKADALSGSNTGDGTNDMKRSVTFAGSYSTPSSENTVPARVEGTGSILRGSYGGSSTYTDFRMRGFNDKEVRTGFIRKVYSLLFAMLAVTTGILACCIFIDDARRFVMQQYEVAYIAIGIYFVSVFIIQCCPGLLRQHPMNLIVLILYTLSLGYMVVFISLYYKTQSVLLAFGICSACCFSITIFALTTTIDFTKCGIYLTIALICFMVFSFIMIFVQAPMAHKIYAAIGAVLFMGILLFNTQLIIGGKEFELSPDEYVVAAILLYASIIQIFLFILELLGERRR